MNSVEKKEEKKESRRTRGGEQCWRKKDSERDDKTTPTTTTTIIISGNDCPEATHLSGFALTGMGTSSPNTAQPIHRSTSGIVERSRRGMSRFVYGGIPLVAIPLLSLSLSLCVATERNKAGSQSYYHLWT